MTLNRAAALPFRDVPKFTSMAIKLPQVLAKAPEKLGHASRENADAAARVNVLVEMKDAPAFRAYLDAVNAAGGDADRAKRSAKAAVSGSIQALDHSQRELLSTLAKDGFGATVIYRVQRVLNAVAMTVPRGKLAAIRALPGVSKIYPLVPERPTGGLDVSSVEKTVPLTATSDPFLGTQAVWSLPGGITGKGIRVGIIDTGIDFIHPDFGGSGLLADYMANDVTVGPNAFFPNAKVVGGIDFAGDSYDGSNAPMPDGNPMDKYGHGTHVAGILAGFGVNADGTTYRGAYDGRTPFSSLRIGPGIAPGALLYSIRIFGGEGDSSLTVQGIDWALDPNGDNDFSDRLDVINMSLGTDYGTLSETSALAAENAAQLGMLVAISSGNSGDTYFITGTPGSATSALTVASSIDTRKPGAVLVVNSPDEIAGRYAAGGNAFPGSTAPNSQSGTVVYADPPDASMDLNNAAQMAGNVALLDRSTYPFEAQAVNAMNAGAIGVIIVNDIPGDPAVPVMPHDGSRPTVTIPAVFISQADGDTLKAQLAQGVSVTFLSTTLADTLSSFSSRGPRLDLPVHLKPDISAPGQSIVSAQSGNVNTSGPIVSNPSGYIPGGQALTLTGTSMACPWVAGMLALLKQLHPGYTVEELKALVLNNALHDLTLGGGATGPVYGPGRSGAGRLDPALAAGAAILAFDADDKNAVSLSFGDVEVDGFGSVRKNVRVENHGNTAATLDLDFVQVTQVPGVNISLPGGNSITVEAGSSVVIPVQLSADASLMQHLRDATVAELQAAPAPLDAFGSLPRHWIAEHSGFLTFSAQGQTKLRLPFYALPHPVSTMAGPSEIPVSGSSGLTSFGLSGNGVNTGSLLPHDIVSLVTPFELQAVNPRNPAIPAEMNIQHVGVAYDSSRDLILFGISTWGNWSTPTQVSFNVYVDADSNGTYDTILFNSDPGNISSRLFGSRAPGQDSFVDGVLKVSALSLDVASYTNLLPSSVADTQLMGSNVIILAASPAQLGLASGTTNFAYIVQTYSDPLGELLGDTPFDSLNAPLKWDYANPGLDFGGAFYLLDDPSTTVDALYDTTKLAANNSLGALLLHSHNVSGTRAQAIPVQGTPGADLSITLDAPAAPLYGSTVVLTLTAANSGAGDAVGVTVADALPPGLVYAADDGEAAYDPVQGVWTLGNVTAGASMTLHLSAKLTTFDEVVNSAAISAASPLDPNPANNQAKVRIKAPPLADVAVQAAVDVPSLRVGALSTFTYTVSNAGPSSAFNVVTSTSFLNFPSLRAQAFTVSDGVFDSGSGKWKLASLPAGGSAILTFMATAPDFVGTFSGKAEVTAETTDPNGANNVAVASTAVLSPAVVYGTMRVSGNFIPGGSALYTIVLSDMSPYDQFDGVGDEFSNTWPAEVAVGSATASSGQIIVSGNKVTWNGSIASTKPVTLTIATTIDSAAAGKLITTQGAIRFDSTGDGSNAGLTLTDDPLLPGASDPTAFIVGAPDLRIALTHTGNFTQTDAADFYTIVVSNSGSAPSNGAVQMVDTLPAGLTVTGLSGPGWTIDPANLIATRSDALAAGASFPPLTLTISVDANAPPSVTNIAAVSGGGEIDATNNNASDVTTIQPAYPDLTVKMVRSAELVQGDTASYALTVTNAGRQPTTGIVTLADLLPAGLAVASITGPGWNTDPLSVTASRSDVLPAGSSFPDLILKVNVALDAGGTLTNVAAVSGGGEVDASNDTATDSAPVTLAPPDLAVTISHTGAFIQGQTGAAFTIVAANIGKRPTSGVVKVSDVLPPGLSAAALAGDGWTIDPTGVSAARSDTLLPGASYPPLTLLVNVAADAAPNVTLTAAVSGGGEKNLSNDASSDTVTILPQPIFSSGPSATPNPAIVDVAVLFTAIVNPADAVVTWNFGDGSPDAAGAAVSHIFTASGTYTIAATVTNDVNVMATKTLDLQVSTGQSLAGTNPFTSVHGSMRIGPSNDQVTLNARWNSPLAAFNPALPLRISVGGVSRSFTFSKYGHGRSGDAVATLHVRAGSAILSLIVRGTLKAALTTGVTVDAQGLPKIVPVVIDYGGMLYSRIVPLHFMRNTVLF